MSNTSNATTPAVSYPFITQKEIVSRIASDDNFAFSCFKILCDKQASKESGGKGLASSDAIRVSKLFKELAESGADVDPVTLRMGEVSNANKERILQLARTGLMQGKGIQSYRKQLAAHFREEQLLANPELETVNAIFFQSNAKK